MAVCGKCKKHGVDVAHIRACYGARPDASVAEDGTVPRRGENYYTTTVNQNLYDQNERDREFEEFQQWKREKELREEHPGHGKADLSVKPKKKKNRGAEAFGEQGDSQPPVKPASERQLRYIRDLRQDKGLEPLAFSGSTRQASREIERLKGLPNVSRTNQHPKEVLEDGIYQLDDEIYKVIHAVHGSGFQYAKKLLKTFHPEGHKFAGAPKGDFVKVEGIMHKLRPEMLLPLEEALAFGKIYGFCVRCGKTLTREDSIERGMGSKCAGIMEDGGL